MSVKGVAASPETRARMAAGQVRAWADGKRVPNLGGLAKARAAQMMARLRLAAAADPNCIKDGSLLRHVRFGRCDCGGIEPLLAAETPAGFFCCDCRAVRVEAVIAARKLAAD